MMNVATAEELRGIFSRKKLNTMSKSQKKYIDIIYVLYQ